MAQHKWHKEIKAWADGKTIQARWNDKMSNVKHDWHDCDGLIDWDLPASDFRIKPQPSKDLCCKSCGQFLHEKQIEPKEPQYLYVYGSANSTMTNIRVEPIENHKYFLGKIKLEVDDE